MIPFELVEVTNGTTTLNLTGTGYQLQSYGMQIAPRQAEALATWPFADVEEPITLHVTGHTPAQAYANLAALIDLWDQAVLWNDGLSSTAVRIRVKPQLSSKTIPSESIILGYTGESAITPQPEFDVANGVFLIRNVTWLIRRRWWWLNETDTSSESAANNPDVQVTSGFAARQIPSPIQWTWASGVPNSLNIAYQLYAIQSSNIQLSAITGAATADSAAFAPGTNVRRVSGTTTITQTLSLATDVSRVAMFITARLNTATDIWRLQASVQRSGIAISNPIEYTIVDIGLGANPQVIFVGLMDILPGAAGASMTVDMTLTLVSGAGTLDLSRVVFADGRGLQLCRLTLQGTSTAGDLSINPLTTSQPLPLVSAGLGLTSYDGNPGFVCETANPQVLLFGITDVGGTGYWVLVNDAISGARSIGMAATRRRAYLAPE